MSQAAYEAFRRSDALCRGSVDPNPRNLLIRSRSLRALGDPQAADADLARVLDVGSFDPRIQADILAIHPDPVVREAAARAILAHPGAAAHDREAACEHLLATRGFALEMWRDDDALSGRMAWRGDGRPRLAATGASGPLAVVTHDAMPPLLPGAASARFTIAAPGEEAVRLDVDRNGRPVESATLAPVRRANHPATGVHDPDTLSVIVPVYGGRDLTRACLSALASQTCTFAREVLVVEDASPDPGLSRDCVETCRENGWRYLRHAINAGFAASVNHGLALARGGHLLLLNADAILPPGALDRLRAAAAHPDVGTVVPFSNDGGFTSFPAPRLRFPPPGAEAARRIDAAARAANAGRVQDIPAGTAFCMLVTRACLVAVGGLDLGYGRGYFEDVDFALRAHRLGFRNVVAADLYVVHVGGQSFGPDKRALVARNARLVQDRFPDYEANWASFLEADPLGPLRGAIERRLPPEEPVRIVVGRPSRLGPALARCLSARASARLRTLALGWSADGTVRIAADDDAVPQNVTFRAHEREALAAYLGRLSRAAIDIAEPDTVPDDLLAPLMRSGAPVSILPADGPAAEAAHAARFRGAAVVGVDAMAQAAIGRPTERLAARSPSRPASTPILPRIAILLPRVTVPALRFVTALAGRPHRLPGGDLVVLGACLEGIALVAIDRVHVTGSMDPTEYPAALRHHAATHLVLPYRDGGFWSLEAARPDGSLPAAFFDWSEGRFDAAAGDLMLPSTLDDDAAAEAVALWSGAAADGALP